MFARVSVAVTRIDNISTPLLVYPCTPGVPCPYGYTLVAIPVDKASKGNANFVGTVPETGGAKTTIDRDKLGAAEGKHLSNETLGPNVAMVKLGEAPHDNVANSFGSDYC